MIQNGDIFISRWYEDDPNTSPGYWNHCAIYYNGNVIESLSDMGVVSWSYEEWLPRMQRVIQLRCFNEVAAENAASYAPTLVGKPYRFIASMFRYLPWWRIKKGLNCVAVVRVAFARAFFNDPLWRTPDDIVSDDRFYSVD